MVNGLTFSAAFAFAVGMESEYFSANVAAYRTIVAVGIATLLVGFYLLLRTQPTPVHRGLGWGLLAGSMVEISGGSWFALTAATRRAAPSYLEASAALLRIAGFERSLVLQAGLLAAVAIALLTVPSEWLRGVLLGAALHLAFTMSVDASAVGRERTLLQQLIGANSNDP